MINFFKERVELQDTDSVVKLHMIIKIFQRGYKLSPADIDTLFELYKVGYSAEFYDNCVSKGYFKTKQSVRNSVGKMTHMGILYSKRRGQRFIHANFAPKVTENQVIFQYLVGNILANEDKSERDI